MNLDSRVRFKSELPVGLNGIEPLVLQLVGLQFINQADAAAFLREVEHDSGRLLRNLAQGKLQLRPAIAALGREHISCKALRVDAHERGFAGNSTVLDSDGFFAGAAFNAKNLELPEAGR